MNALLKKILRYLRIISQFMRVGIVRKSQFRVEFFSQVIMDLIWYFTHILVFEFLYLHTDSIAGWNREEIRVFLGFLFVSDAFMMACLGQNWHFADDLKNGNLDTFRVKPASTIFLYFFQRFSP
ncbi:MAG: ABC-2 family transporter protein, partial [Planctomycetota bacterium]